MRHHLAKRILAILVMIALSTSAILVLYDFHETLYPRPLESGDTWSYEVVFPDAHAYVLTESVQNKLSNGTYLIFRDDDQHLSTGYLWLTSSWYETRESQLHIGNLEASSYTTYNPPIELIHIPLHVDDEWEVSSNLTTRTVIRNQTQINVSTFRESRETSSEELIHTPAGSFKSFMINVFTGSSLFENIWFSTELGQIVSAKFYNPLGEAVTESLIGYNLSDRLTEGGLEIASNSTLSTGTPTIVLCTSRPTLSAELKNSYG